MPEEKNKPLGKNSKKHQDKPDFVYDPESDEFEQSREALALELDPMKNIPDNTLLDPKLLQKKAKRKKRIKRTIIFTLLFSLLLGAGVFTYLAIKAGKISTNPFNFSSKLKGEDEGRVNIMLLGVGDPGHEGETLADTNMVISIDTRNNKVAMISIPRDTRVYIPGEGYAKINNAHAIGETKTPPQGIEIAQKTIEQTLDIPIHYYVRANFSGLKQAVDAVGGIDIDVKDALYDPEYPCEKNEGRSCGFKISAGQTHMDGSTALKYARCRKGNCGDDFGRALRQQEVLQALRTKATSTKTLSDPKKLSGLIEAAANNIKTNMSLSEMQRAYELSKKVTPENTIDAVLSLKPNGFLKSDPSSSDLLPSAGNFDEIKKFVKDIFIFGPIWAEDPKIVLQNGTSVVGIAGKLNIKLTNSGVPIEVIEIQNSDTRDHTTSEIIDYTGGKMPNTIKYLEDLLGVKSTQLDKSKRPPSGEDVTVILGTDYADKITQNGTSD